MAAPSPVAPMEDLGTLKEQHREQKLFPQLLQLRCRQETSMSDGATLRHLTPQCLFPSLIQFCKTEEGSLWGGNGIGQNSQQEAGTGVGLKQGKYTGLGKPWPLASVT